MEKNKDLLKDDYIVNLNSILLNSGFDFSLNDNQNLKVIIIHKNDQNESTIFAKNFLNIKKNSKLLIIEKLASIPNLDPMYFIFIPLLYSDLHMACAGKKCPPVPPPVIIILYL